jgi:integrase/recombinase XerD
VPTQTRPIDFAQHPELRLHARGFLDYLQAECGLSRNTREAYRRDLVHFSGHLEQSGVKNLADLLPRHIEGFLRYLKNAGLSAASASRALAAVRMFCRYLVIQRVLSQDVSASVEAPKKWNRLPAVLGDSGVRTLMSSPRQSQNSCALRDEAVLSLLYATGMRASELAGLKLEDVNDRVGIVRVLGKGSKERIVPAAEAAIDAVGRYVRECRPRLLRNETDRTLFLSRNGRALRREEVFRIVRRHVRASALPGRIGPHTLRHSFATQLLAHGADLRSVQEMLGHADIATTEIYTHVDAQKLKSIHKQFHPRG